MKKNLLALLSFFVVVPLFAQRYSLTVKEAVALAIEGNLSLKQEAIALKTKERNKNWVANRFLPSINLNSSLNYNLQEPSDSVSMVPDLSGPSFSEKGKTIYPNSSVNAVQVAGKDLPRSAIAFSFSLQLPINPALFLAIDTTKKEYQNGLISYTAAEAQLEKEVKKIYYNLLLLKETVALLEANIETAEKRYQQAMMRYKNGYLPKLQMLNAKASLENLRPQLTAQKHYYDSAVMNFKIYLGLDFQDEIELIEDSLAISFYTVDTEKLLAQSILNRLDIQLLMGNIDLLKQSKTAALVAAFSPTFLLGLNYAGSSPLYPANSPLKPEKMEFSKNGSLSLGISFPIDQYIYGSKSWQAEKEQEDSLKALEIRLKSALRTAELDIRKQVMGLEKSKQNIETLQFNLALNEELYQESEQGYNAGRVDMIDLEEVQDRLNQAKLNLIQEKVQYLTAVAELEYAINGELSSGLLSFE